MFGPVIPSIASIVRNHPTDLLLQNAEKMLRKYADGYAATSLTLHSSVCVFFFLSRFSLKNIHDSQDCRERERLSLWLLSTTSSRFRALNREPLVPVRMCIYCKRPSNTNQMNRLQNIRIEIWKYKAVRKYKTEPGKVSTCSFYFCLFVPI